MQYDSSNASFEEDWLLAGAGSWWAASLQAGVLMDKRIFQDMSPNEQR